MTIALHDGDGFVITITRRMNETMTREDIEIKIADENVGMTLSVMLDIDDARQLVALLEPRAARIGSPYGGTRAMLSH